MLTDRLLRGAGLTALCIALTACGAEREEPFDPGEPDEEPREPVAVRILFEREFFPPTELDTLGQGKRLEILSNDEEYDEVVGAYDLNYEMGERPDFEQSQVLLYDGGWIDENPCEQQVTLRRAPRAESITSDENLVEVTLEYQLSRASTDPSCDGEENIFRPFGFYVIDTRADILIVEKVPSLSRSGSSASSSSRSNN